MAFLSGWTKAKAITIPAAYVTGSLTNFPLSVQFTNDAQIGAAALANGYDLRFTLADGITVLSSYRRSFSITGGQATGIYDVLVPSLTSGVNGSLLCQYGNASATDVSNSAAVFGSSGAGFAGAWGFGDGVTLDLTDLSGNGNNGTNYGATAAAGIMGGAASFDGTDDYIATGNSGIINGATQVTYSVWVKPNGYPNNHAGILLSRGTKQNGLAMYFSSQLILCIQSTNLYYGSAPANGSWSHLVGTWISTTGSASIYINGNPVSGTLMTGQAIQQDDVFKCGLDDAVSSRLWCGLLDEPRISSVARSAAWVYLDWAQVANQSSVVTWGAEQSTTTPSLFRRRSQIIGSGLGV